MNRHQATAMGVAAATMIAAAGPAPAGTASPCGADLDASGIVNGIDLATMLGQWTGSAAYSPCPPTAQADLNSDCRINGLDLAVLLGQWGPTPVFDYGPALPNTEAFQIALEMLGPGGPLLPTTATYDRIDRDLALIRAHTPALTSETHTPAWAPNRLIVKVLDGADTTRYECLNNFYQMTGSQFLFSFGGGSWYALTFAGTLNVEALATIYAAQPEIDSAEPDGLIGGQNFWTPTPLAGGVWHWSIDDGFHDCFDGCDCHRLYVFQTDARGTVTLISYQEVGAPWCDFGT